MKNLEMFTTGFYSGADRLMPIFLDEKQKELLEQRRKDNGNNIVFRLGRDFALAYIGTNLALTLAAIYIKYIE